MSPHGINTHRMRTHQRTRSNRRHNFFRHELAAPVLIPFTCFFLRFHFVFLLPPFVTDICVNRRSPIKYRPLERNGKPAWRKGSCSFEATMKARSSLAVTVYDLVAAGRRAQFYSTIFRNFSKIVSLIVIITSEPVQHLFLSRCSPGPNPRIAPAMISFKGSECMRELVAKNTSHMPTYVRMLIARNSVFVCPLRMGVCMHVCMSDGQLKAQHRRVCRHPVCFVFFNFFKTQICLNALVL